MRVPTSAANGADVAMIDGKAKIINFLPRRKKEPFLKGLLQPSIKSGLQRKRERKTGRR
jgi:hypothetical protein